MASVISMDAADAADLGRRHSGGPLAVSKASGKIGKGLRRPVAQPRPAPTVYKIEAGHFRSLVQELTGTAPVVEHVAPRSSGNARLHKIAPPPLRPTFSYAKFGGGQPLQPFTNGLPPMNSPTNGQRFNNIPFGGFGPAISPASQRMTPFPMLSPHTFSPLPALSPSDQVWANTLESPTSAAMRQLAQKIASNENQPGDIRLENGAGGLGSAVTGGIGAGAFPGQSPLPSPVSMSPFSLSPQMSSAQFANLPSPTGTGMASGFNIGSMYQMGALHSPTAGIPTMDFAFPEPDYMVGLS